MLPQRSSRWFGPAWPTGPARPPSPAAQLGSWRRLLLARGLRMTTATRQEVLGLYRRIFRLVRKWQAASGQMEDTIKEKQYILNEARTLFQKNKNIHLPPMGLTPLRGRGLRSQEKLRKLSKPVYLKSHDEIS
ncbi:LYR motif-containing protein 1 isoform X3 [Puma concolor]|nr:LYR motif-containing protein 1 isoform X3 [Puma concolor]